MKIFSDLNEIEDIVWDSISFLPSLKTLDLSSNKFIKILSGTLEAMPRIRRLKLSNNYINEIDVGALHNLQDLGIFQTLALLLFFTLLGFVTADSRQVSRQQDNREWSKLSESLECFYNFSRVLT